MSKPKDSLENIKSIKLYIEKPGRRDIGRAIARIDLDTLGLRTGDVILLNGKVQSACFVWPSYPKDKGKGIIRIDSLIRKNTLTILGDSIEVRKVEPKIAQHIVLAPMSEKDPLSLKSISFFKKKLNNYPVTIDDIILISIGISREITFKVLDLKPKGVCIISKKKTHLIINEDP